MVELYNPMGYEIEPEIEWEECGLAKEHHGDYSRMRSQWYSPLQAFEMVMHREPYDVVVKTRFDIDYLEPLQADILNVVRNGNLMLFSPYPISTQRGVYSDTVVIARPNIMEKYLNYFHHIEEFFHQSKVKMGVPGYCSEYGATAYMKFNGFWGTVPGFMTIKPSIVRSNGERIKLYP